jgi:hypothetical protein
MIRVRTLALLVSAVCGLASAQEPRPFPPSAAEKTVTLEARWVTVPVGFCDRHLPASGGSILNEKEFTAFAVAWTDTPKPDVQVAPLMHVPSGQEGTVQIGDTRLFVTGLKAHVVNGTGVLVPQNEPIELGPVVKVRPTASADGKGVKLDVTGRRSVVEKVEMIPLVSQIQPVPEAGRKPAPPVPFTQYVQAPTIRTQEVSKKLTVPVGGTAVIRGWHEPVPEREPEAVTNAIPYLNRVFKNVSNKPPMVEVVLLVTARDVATAPQSAAPPVTTGEVIPAAAVEPGPRSVAVAVAVDMRILEASPAFAADLGFSDAQPSPACVFLTGREHQLSDALIRAYKLEGKLDVLSCPSVQVPDRQTGFAMVGAEGGARVESRVTPAVAEDGQSVVLRVRFKQVTTGGSVALANGTKAPAFNTQETETTAATPFGGTVVMRLAKSSADGKKTDTLIFLTPHKGELPK